MLWMDSLGQNVIGLSEPFWIIRFKEVSFKQKKYSRFPRTLKMSKNSLEPSELTENLPNRPKSSRKLSKFGLLR